MSSRSCWSSVAGVISCVRQRRTIAPLACVSAVCALCRFSASPPAGVRLLECLCAAVRRVRAVSWVAAAAHFSRVQGTLVACTHAFELPVVASACPHQPAQRFLASDSCRSDISEWPPHLTESRLRSSRTRQLPHHRRCWIVQQAQRNDRPPKIPARQHHVLKFH